MIMTDELKNRMIDNIWFGFDNQYHRFYKNNPLIPADAIYEVDTIFKNAVRVVGKNKLWVEIYFTVKDEDGKDYILKSSDERAMMCGDFLLEARIGETIIKDIKYCGGL